MVDRMKEFQMELRVMLEKKGCRIMLKSVKDEKSLDSLVYFTVTWLLSQVGILKVWVSDAMWGRGLISNLVQERRGFIIW